ncbi:MAG: hypothetical protein MUE85_17290 [Microscillaceae bacterium]|jgi:hypothetical protein|nr:hypothetical protein [Microscillaceae bacterium]
MEHKIYGKKDLKKPTFFQKVLGQKIKDNALVEINNLLAEKELATITVEDIYAIANQYGVDLLKDYDNEMSMFYKEYLTSCLEDKFISESELADLRHLKLIFGLNDKQIDEIHQELAGKVYKSEVDKVIQDGELDEEERQFIEKLQNDLKLPSEVAGKIYQTSGQELIRNFMTSAIADAKLTPEEEKELLAIAKNLNAELKFDDATKNDLEKYKLYWRIENDELPELHVDINIPRNEKCYFFTEAEWMERSIDDAAKTLTFENLRLKIAKGLYWRKSTENDKDLKKEGWQVVDNGTLYLTNKRVLFKGQKGDKIVLLNRIFDFIVFSNGIEVEKEGERHPFLRFEKNTDIFAMLLGKAISQLRV